MLIENVRFIVGSSQWGLRKDVKIPLLDHKEVTSFGALSLYHRILVMIEIYLWFASKRGKCYSCCVMGT